jgi:hypothetical protein
MRRGRSSRRQNETRDREAVNNREQANPLESKRDILLYFVMFFMCKGVKEKGAADRDCKQEKKIMTMGTRTHTLFSFFLLLLLLFVVISLPHLSILGEMMMMPAPQPEGQLCIKAVQEHAHLSLSLFLLLFLSVSV